MFDYLCNRAVLFFFSRPFHENSKFHYPKNGQKTVNFRFFPIFSENVHTIRTKISTVILHHVMVLYGQFHKIRMAGM